MTTYTALVSNTALTFDDLSQSGKWKVIEDAKTSEALLLEIVENTEIKKNDSPLYFREIVENKGVTIKVITAIVNKVDWKNSWHENVLKALAKNPLTPVELLVNIVVEYRVAAVRAAAVKNPNTPTEAIEGIAKWSHGKMLAAVIEKELARRSAL